MNRRIALGLVAAAPFARSVPAGAAAAALRVATLPVDASALVYYADDMGFLKNNGLTVELHKIAGGAIPPAVAGGALDIGWSNMVSLAAAYKRGIPFRVVGAGGVYVRGNPTSALFVAADSPLRSGHDLSGKTIACDALVNFGQFSTQGWIDKNGGDASTARFIEMPFSDMAPALAQKRVDAAFIGEPFIRQANGAIRQIGAPIDLVGDRVMIGAWFTTLAWAQQNHDALAAFAQAMSDTATWANRNPDRSAAILAKYSGVDPAVVASMRRIAYGTRPVAAEMQGVIDLAARYHAIPATFGADELIFR